MQKKKIFLTGGNGFIGRNIQEQLASEYEIFAPKSSELDLVDTTAVEQFIKSNNFDVVIHGANTGGHRKSPGPDNMAELNLKMFFNLARCNKYFGKMIQLGSGAEYCKEHYMPRMKEEYFDTYMPSDSYGFYKYVCSKYIKNSENIICLRVFGCYGKYEDYEVRFISNAIGKSIFNLPITIHNKNVVFSYLYADDLVQIIQYFIENNGKYKFYNATPDWTDDLISIAKKMNQVAGKDLEIKVNNPGMGREYSGDNSRLKTELPDIKFTTLESGIKKLYVWYEQNKDSIDKEKLIVDRY